METLFVGNNTIHLIEVDSTNSYARALLKDVKVPEGTVIWTDNQTAGRGQRGSNWNAEPGANITLSLILTPTFLKAGNHFFLSKAVALAIHATLTELLVPGNYDIKIKWPNDILVNGKKICGVLIEHTFRTDAIMDSVIGIGLNVNQENFGELGNKATSLKLLTGQDFDRETVMRKLMKHIEVNYLQLRQNKEKIIQENYLKHLLLLAEDHDFLDLRTNITFRGKITNVLPNGHIEIFSVEEGVRRFDLKEVGFGRLD